MRGKSFPLFVITLLVLLFSLVGTTAHGRMANSSPGSPTNDDVSEGGSAPARVAANTAGVCPSRQPGNDITVEFTGATYTVAGSIGTGFFQTGQNADIMLSGIDFNNTGGSLLFNHPTGIASDGTHLLLADRFNNRILIWNSLPAGNTAPDLVLGQPDFTANDPGTTLDRLNWPGSVAVTPDGRVVVADTENNRLLIWTSFPTQSGQAADLALDISALEPPGAHTPFDWPWGVWTDGQKLVASVTRGASLLIWNSFPTQNDQPFDLLLTGQDQSAQDQFGTPRTITSDGTHLIVGDHNPGSTASPQHNQGSFFWQTFPTTGNPPYDFFMSDPNDPNFAWLQGDFTAAGKLLLLGRTLHIWNSFPQSTGDPPGLSITGYDFDGGDGADVAVAGSKVYISLYNGNKVVAYNAIPTAADQAPDFAIGSTDICTNTLDTHFFIGNPVIASNGTSLFVSSDFDNALYVWKQIPDESGAYPDIVYHLPASPYDDAVWGNTLAVVGRDTVYIWTQLPLNGALPDRTIQGSLGSVTLQNLGGVAMDDQYFYLADGTANKVYIWDGVPTAGDNPHWTLDVTGAGRLSSDGTYLAIAVTPAHEVWVYRIADLAAGSPTPTIVGKPSGKQLFNGPTGVAVGGGHLFVGDTGFNRVEVWSDIANALADQDPDVILGEQDLTDIVPEIGRDKLFWPGALDFDGNYLWVGEVKFSSRILRFSPTGPAATVTPTPTGGPATATPTPTPTPTQSPISNLQSPYLLSFHACDTGASDCANPDNHRVYLAQSDDGANWSLVPGWTTYAGSVPDVIRRGDTLYVYTPGYVRRYRFATDTWEDPVPVTLTDPDADSFVDPSLYVDDQGRLVLFYLLGVFGQDPAGCAPGESTCVKHFHSATEVAGSDGTQFVAESGDRAQVAVNAPATASDPDIFYDGSRYVLYISRGPNIQVYTSSTLHGSYALWAQLPNNGYLTSVGGIGSGYFDSATGHYWTYVHTNQGVIHRAVHASLDAQLTDGDFTTVLSGSSIGLGASYWVESPGFAVNTAGTAPSCPDFDGDGQVGIADLQAVATHWHLTSSDPNYQATFDVDEDGVITVLDVMLVAVQWGPCP